MDGQGRVLGPEDQAHGRHGRYLSGRAAKGLHQCRHDVEYAACLARRHPSRLRDIRGPVRGDRPHCRGKG